MAQQIFGDRIGKQSILTPACAAVIFDPQRRNVLLTRRSDNGRWCLPGGAMDPGESITECCAREVLEETGLIIRVGRLIGIYSNPHRIIEYADGNRRQGLNLLFEAKRIGGELLVTDETTEVGYFSTEQIKSMDVMEPSGQSIEDAMSGQEAAFSR